MAIKVKRRGPISDPQPEVGDWTSWVTHDDYPGMHLETDFYGTEQDAIADAEEWEQKVNSDPANYFEG